MIAAHYLHLDCRIVSGLEVQRDEVAFLLRFIAGESGVACNVFQLTADVIVSDFDIRLQVRYGLAEEIYSCQSIGIY